jgi:hypothetical protein
MIGGFRLNAEVLAMVAQRVPCERAHIRDHLGRPQTVHGDLALGCTKLERSCRRGGGRVDDLDEIEAKLARVPQRVPDKVGVGGFDARVQARVREVEDGGDAVGLDGLAGEVLGVLEIWKRILSTGCFFLGWAWHSRSTWTMLPRIHLDFLVVSKTWP